MVYGEANYLIVHFHWRKLCYDFVFRYIHPAFTFVIQQQILLPPHCAPTSFKECFGSDGSAQCLENQLALHHEKLHHKILTQYYSGGRKKRRENPRGNTVERGRKGPNLQA